jgi:hypothetical protein
LQDLQQLNRVESGFKAHHGVDIRGAIRVQRFAAKEWGGLQQLGVGPCGDVCQGLAQGCDRVTQIGAKCHDGTDGFSAV